MELKWFIHVLRLATKSNILNRIQLDVHWEYMFCVKEVVKYNFVFQELT